MNWLLKMPKLIRRLRGAFWRRALSKPIEILLQNCYGIQFGCKPIFVGWPIFQGDGLIQIGDNCALVSAPWGNPIGLFRPCIIESVWPHSIVRIGNNFSASGICIVAETEVIIGNNVSIGANATIVDTDFHAINADARRDGRVGHSKATRIEDDVWIGMNVIILKGVTIHQGAVIGANSVVTKDIPSASRAVGNPARILSESGELKSFTAP